MTKQGLYLIAPHGRLIFAGEKKVIATGRKFPITGERVICSKEDGIGLAFGVAQIDEPSIVDAERFDDYYSLHKVPKSSRLKWWADKTHLYHYPIQSFSPFPEPIEIEIEAGTIMDMGEVELPFDPGEKHLVISSPDDKIMSSLEEKGMPWTANDAIRFTKEADTPEKRRLWAGTANGRLDQCVKDGGDRKDCEASAVRVANAAVAREKQFEMQQFSSALVKAIADELERRGMKAGDDGEGEVGHCACPNCKTTFESDEPCSESNCPECSSGAHGEDDKANGEKVPGTEPEPMTRTEPEPTKPDPEPVTKPEVKPETEEKAGRRISNSILDKLRDVAKTISDLVKHGEYADKEPDVVEAISARVTPIVSKGFKSLGDDWFMIWPTNAYKDREEETFATKAIGEYVARHRDSDVKGEAWYRHRAGSKFGTIYAQAQVADHFICQLGKYDDTPVGKAFKAFFAKYPDSHPTIAPNGWGASHKFHYLPEDRETGTYQHFDIQETTVLPFDIAANQYNPRPIMGGFKQMDEKERAEFNAIGEEAGVTGLADQVIQLGNQLKEKLDQAGVERKAVKPEEQVPKKPEDEDESQNKKDVAGELADKVAERLGLHDLSTTIGEILETQKALHERLTNLDTTVEQVKQSDEEKVAQTLGTPRYVWQAFQASKADETATTPAATPTASVPEAVKGIASRIGS